jgi:hypothetical protein
MSYSIKSRQSNSSVHSDKPSHYGKSRLKNKVWVTVELNSSLDELYQRKRIESTDTAGRYVCYFTGSQLSTITNIPSRRKPSGWEPTHHFSSSIHIEDEKELGQQHVPLSKATPPKIMEEYIMRMFASRCDIPFLGPAYPTKHDASIINDTQLYVSGAIEDIDGDSEAAALREVREEIGLEPKYISYIGKVDDKGRTHYLHHAVV